jgi:hypothetical protein
MISAFRSSCMGHREALVDFVDRREMGPGTAAALRHLDRCRACEDDLAGIARTITALRRVHRYVAAAEPRPDAWLRLRERIGRPRQVWRWRTTLAGLTTSTLLVGVLAAPVSFGRPSADHLPQPSWLTYELHLEAQYLANARVGELPPTPRTTGSGIPQNYPPEIWEVRKEVQSAKPTLRPAKPI